MDDKNLFDDLLKDVEELFGKVFSYNCKLLELCNKENYEPNYVEVFDFYITSNAMSLLKNFKYEYVESQGILLNARCVIEGLAVKEAFKKGRFDSTNFELLKRQCALIEYNQYKKFKDCYDFFLIPGELEKEYKESYDFFKKNLKSVSDKELKEIARSQAPFACNPKLSFKSIVEENLGESWAVRYAFLSSLIHPTSNAFETDKGIIFMLMDVIKLIKDEYDDMQDGFSLRALGGMVFASPEALQMIESVKSECTDIENVMADFNKNFGRNYVSDTFHKISMTIQEMTFDMIFGLREQVKSKWKVLIETLAGFYESYLREKYVNDSFNLLQAHDNFNVYCLFGTKENKDKSLSESYDIYKAKFSNGIDFTEFSKKFESTTGYTIDESGKTKSLTYLVNQLADVFKTDEKINSADMIKMNYVEAQMMSHANGYMWFANTGAWADVNNMYGIFNQIMCYICFCMSGIYKGFYEERNEYKYKKTSNILKSAGNHIRDNTKNIYRILAKAPNPCLPLNQSNVSEDK